VSGQSKLTSRSGGQWAQSRRRRVHAGKQRPACRHQRLVGFKDHGEFDQVVAPHPDQRPGPRLHPVALREYGDAFATAAISRSRRGRTLGLVRRYDLVEFAVVLEPDEPLVSARRALFAGMNAAATRLPPIARPNGR